MPYVQRRGGDIVGLYATPQPDMPLEYLPDDDPEVLAGIVVPPEPIRCSRAQARLVLTEAGLWPQVVAAVQAYADPAITIWFEDATEWSSDNAYVMGLAIELGLTDAQVDALFKAARARL